MNLRDYHEVEARTNSRYELSLTALNLIVAAAAAVVVVVVTTANFVLVLTKKAGGMCVRMCMRRAALGVAYDERQKSREEDLLSSYCTHRDRISSRSAFLIETAHPQISKWHGTLRTKVCLR